MLPQLAKIRGAVLDFLFPQWCVGCGLGGELLCYSCRQSQPRIVPPICPRCGRPQTGGLLCSRCVSWQAALDGIRSPFRFDGVIRQAVHQFKYRNLRTLAPLLARLLADYLIANPIPCDVLVPVPLHQKRLRERGYNQSSLMAGELARLVNLPVVNNCLIRERYTIPQARSATVNQRHSNVAHAFTCRNKGIRDKQVMLVDDVATTGATLNACAEALKAAGATSVWGLVLAHED